MRKLVLAAVSSLALIACNAPADSINAGKGAAAPARGKPFHIAELGQFDQPWAMTFLPNGLLLGTEKEGRIRFVDFGPSTPRLGTVTGVPEVDEGGQGGLGEVVAHPDFARNNLLYISYAEAGPNDTRGAAVARARLDCREADACTLQNLQVIWRQSPKVDGRGHYGHRLAFSRDGHLFITNGDRQKFDPAQDMNAHLGKIVRLRDDGSTPRDNPFASRGGVAAQIWSLGHRNPLGIAFAPDGRLWSHEMGPKNGDEFNLIERGSNYGYPIVSNGSHYDGKDIPDHGTRPEFNAPEITWNGVSPAGMMIYTGSMFPEWRGDAFLGGLSGQTLIRVDIDGARAREAERWDMGQRIREVEQAPDGSIYVLEDSRNGSGGRLLKLSRPR